MGYTLFYLERFMDLETPNKLEKLLDDSQHCELKFNKFFDKNSKYPNLEKIDKGKY